MKRISGLLFLLFQVAVAMIGYHMHKDIGWAIVDFIFAPIVAIYWLVTNQVNLTLIKETFEPLLK
jgi:hypothetical protein